MYEMYVILTKLGWAWFAVCVAVFAVVAVARRVGRGRGIGVTGKDEQKQS